jgi:hypothetical protein
VCLPFYFPLFLGAGAKGQDLSLSPRLHPERLSRESASLSVKNDRLSIGDTEMFGSEGNNSSGYKNRFARQG